MTKLSKATRLLLTTFLIAFCLSLTAFPQTAIYYIQDIAPGTVSNPDVSYFPKKINDNGYITGFKYVGFNTISQYWIGGFEYPAGSTNSVAYNISDGNLVVGRGNFGVYDNRAYTFSPSSGNITGSLVQFFLNTDHSARHTR